MILNFAPKDRIQIEVVQLLVCDVVHELFQPVRACVLEATIIDNMDGVCQIRRGFQDSI
jgi:hypothetical protein